MSRSGGYIPAIPPSPPLDPEEESALLIACAAGDQSAVDRIGLAYMPMVGHMIRQLRGCGLDVEEMMSLGSFALASAIRHFRPSCGTKLSTYAYTSIRNAIVRGATVAARDRRRTAHADISNMGGPDVDPDVSCPLSDLDRVLSCLTDYERRILVLRSQGVSFSAIGREFGYSPKRAQQVYRSALSIARRVAEGEAVVRLPRRRRQLVA